VRTIVKEGELWGAGGRVFRVTGTWGGKHCFCITGFRGVWAAKFFRGKAPLSGKRLRDSETTKTEVFGVPENRTRKT